MLLYVCISGHGFGHGSRVAAVLNAVHRLQPSWRIVLSTPLPASFLALAFAEIPFEQRDLRWDVGVIQADALGADPDATLAALEAVEQQMPQQVEQELAWLQQQGDSVLVLPMSLRRPPAWPWPWRHRWSGWAISAGMPSTGPWVVP